MNLWNKFLISSLLTVALLQSEDVKGELICGIGEGDVGSVCVSPSGLSWLDACEGLKYLVYLSLFIRVPYSLTLTVMFSPVHRRSLQKPFRPSSGSWSSHCLPSRRILTSWQNSSLFCWKTTLKQEPLVAKTSLWYKTALRYLPHPRDTPSTFISSPCSWCQVLHLFCRL